MPPFLGQGLNSGIRDAANLAWLLALLAKGGVKESLLDDYAAERSGQVAQIVEETVGMGHLICMTDPEESELRDAGLKALGSEGLQAMGMDKSWLLQGGTLQDDGIGGNLGLQATVSTGTRTGLLDEVITPPGFVLLGRDRDPADLLSPVHRADWKQLGGSSAHFGPGGLTDTEGKYAEWFDRLNASVVLIRPDFQIFGGVHTPHAADGLVHNLTERILT